MTLAGLVGIIGEAGDIDKSEVANNGTHGLLRIAKTYLAGLVGGAAEAADGKADEDESAEQHAHKQQRHHNERLDMRADVQTTVHCPRQDFCLLSL